MRISVKSDVDKLKKHLNYLEKKQIPFATMIAINNVAYKVKRGLDGSTKQYMDRPAPFSQKPTAYEKAKKKHLVAVVSVRARQLEYLQYIIEGKSERGRTVPVQAKRNAYGNLKRGYVRANRGKKNFFSGRPKGGGHKGLYERTNRNKKLKLHAVYKDQVSHKKAWPFHRIAKKIVGRHFVREMDKALDRAMRTAR